MVDGQKPVPRATYRLQLSGRFTFADAARLAPYLEKLGVSHVYLSPILMARAGSTHGYDTTDHQRINPELGGMEAFRAMARAFDAHGLGLILDFVPNHMGIGGDENPYWLDLLEWGEASRYAGWFDIDWHPHEGGLDGKVLVPVLGAGYGEALVSGALELRLDAAAGRLSVWAHGQHRLPLWPRTYDFVLSGVDPELDLLAQGFAGLDREGEPKAAAEALKGRLSETLAAHPDAARALNGRLARLNGRNGEVASKRELDALVLAQNWRPARFDVADDEINYRRFFAVSELAAIRIEREDVFEHAHRLVSALIEEGLVGGLRIDHVDGLYDPGEYCRKVRERAPRPIYLVVEKILSPGERLRADWRADGTTGYEFAGLVNRLLVDPATAEEVTAAYADFGGRPDFAAAERAGKLRIMRHELHAELDALSARLDRLAEANIFTRDLTRRRLRHALQAYIAALPRYRTYVTGRGTEPEDRQVITESLAEARRRAPDLGEDVWDFLGGVLTGEAGSDVPDGFRRDARELAMRIQQATGAVMAKGLEDTALYRDNRLIALNDVGARPDAPPISIAEFHAANAERAETFPHTLLLTSSHDSKRGEDVRARIAALSGHAPAWRQATAAWRTLLAQQGAPEIDGETLYYFFQTLLGAWPPDSATGDDPAALPALTERLVPAMSKSAREAHAMTGWARPDHDYEARLEKLVRTALAPGEGNRFLASFRDFEARVARDGAFNGLIATVLKLTVPGVPDIYRGAEIWEQSLVDPDNRRPVDPAPLAVRMASVLSRPVPELMNDWRDGGVKQALIARLLNLRRAEPALFAEGSYEPVTADDADGERVLAFLRRHAEKALLVAVRLYPWRDGEAVISPALALPAGLPADGWHDMLAADTAAGAPAGAPAWAGPLPALVMANFPLGPDVAG